MRVTLIAVFLLLSVLFSVSGLSQSSEREPNDTLTQANHVASLPGCGARTGRASNGDVDYYWFSVSSSTLVVIKTACKSGTDDTIISLEDGQGGVIVEDDDSGADKGSLICEFLHPGTYYVRVRAYGGGRIEEYVVHVSAAGHSRESENNDAQWNANPIGTTPGAIAVSGSIGEGDMDWYQFEVFAGEFPYIATVTAGDTVITLFDHSGALLANNDDSPDGYWSLIDNLWLAPGTYYVMVRAYDEATPISTYTLLVSSIVPVDQRDYDKRAIDSVGVLIRGPGDVSDRYDFEIPTDRIVTLATLTGEDTILSLRNASGEQVGFNDDMTSSDRRSEIMLHLEPGSYYVTVTGYGDRQAGPYILYMTAL